MPRLRSYQIDLVKDQAREICCVSATQIGKTFAYSSKLLNWMWEYPGVHPWWWCAPSYKQSVEGQRVMYHLSESAGIRKSGPKPPFTSNPPPPLVLINGVTCEYRTWDNPDNLMGTPIAGAVVDEAGLLTPLVQSAISSRRSFTLGPLWYIGNPGRVAGPFRRLCNLAETCTDGTRSFHRWTWRDLYEELEEPFKSEYKQFIEQERASQWDVEFRRLYEAQWTEDEAAVFRGVGDAIDGEPLDPFNRPDGDTSARVLGVDVGQQVDYLVTLGLGVDSYRADFIDRYRGVGYPQAAQRIHDIQVRYEAPVVLEINGPGIALAQEFDRLGVSYVPFTTTSQSKQEMILNLAADFQNGRVSMADIPQLIHELSVFRYERMPSGVYRYQAPAGEHDDCVMALALASWGRSRSVNLGEYGWVA